MKHKCYIELIFWSLLPAIAIEYYFVEFSFVGSCCSLREYFDGVYFNEK